MASLLQTWGAKARARRSMKTLLACECIISTGHRDGDDESVSGDDSGRDGKF